MVKAVFIVEELNCTGHRKREPLLAAGTCHWEFYDPPSNGVVGTLNFVCPCGCGEVDFIFVFTNKQMTPGKPPAPDRGWRWDGNKEQPSLMPSIHRLGAACKWHGFLTKGEFLNGLGTATLPRQPSTCL